MKKLLLPVLTMITIEACKPVFYSGSYGQLNQTQVVLDGANFKVLGSFTGTATEKKLKLRMQEADGLVAQAKANMLLKAKAAGVELTGSRTLINVSVDVVQNPKKITATVSAEIIEFTK